MQVFRTWTESRNILCQTITRMASSPDTISIPFWNILSWLFTNHAVVRTTVFQVPNRMTLLALYYSIPFLVETSKVFHISPKFNIHRTSYFMHSNNILPGMNYCRDKNTMTKAAYRRSSLSLWLWRDRKTSQQGSMAASAGHGGRRRNQGEYIHTSKSEQKEWAGSGILLEWHKAVPSKPHQTAPPAGDGVFKYTCL